MASLPKLVALSYAIGWVHAGRFQGADSAKNWGPAKNTAGATVIDPVGWTPKPTSAPGAQPFNFDLRKRQGQSADKTCGYPVDDLDEPAITCQDPGYCFSDRQYSFVGCCSELEQRNCRIPTTCLESTQLKSSRSLDSRTLFCEDPARPHCMTLSYDADFYEPLNGISFLECGDVAGTSSIVATAPPGWGLSSDISTSRLPTSTSGEETSSDASNAVTVTVGPSGGQSSSATAIAQTGASTRTRTGAIVGGVVGGVAGLALIAAILFFCIRHRRRKGAEESPPSPNLDLPPPGVYSGPPGEHYNSSFFGELPPQMAVPQPQAAPAYPQYGSTYQQQAPGYPVTGFDPVAVPREPRDSIGPTTFVPASPKPNDDIVSPISPQNPEDVTYTWVSNPTPPPESRYSQFSPPPPQQYQGYHPYPGT
ncbi:hypothetical protein F4779DRAFT_406627 [Xylariaceae sp. FL0662B]|nr:hypothetical protein F4779DRAFT_406627 [Xylariaceae sp. FL0662B]